MNRLHRASALLTLALALAITGCNGEAEIDVDGDTTVVDTDTSAAVDLRNDDTTNISLDTAASGVTNESIEKLVEAQLILSPGFANVNVESEGDNVIVLSGTVATAEEKANAEAEAMKVVGVKSVTNNITVQ